MKDGMKKNNEFIITLSDLFNICAKAKKKIYLGILGFSSLAVLYSVQQPIKYEAKATFREKVNASGSMDSSGVTSMLFSGKNGNNNSGSISTLKSRKLLENVIQKLGMQASINQRGWNFSRLRRVRDNILVEFALMSNKLHPSLNDPFSLLNAKEVKYAGEIPLSLKITFDSDHTYEVYEGKKKIGDGNIDLPFRNSAFTFTLSHSGEQSLEGKTFTLNLSPIGFVIKDLLANITIETDNDDNTLLRIYYYHMNRHQACELVNELLLAFQNYLKEEQQRVSGEQISYLKSREEEMASQLKTLMEAFGEQVSNDVYQAGFATSETALDFLSRQQLGFEEKVRGIDLKLKRLGKAKESSLVFDTAYLLEVDQSPIQNTILEIQKLKQQSDSIQLALRNSPIQNQEDLRAAFMKQHFDLEEVRLYAEETQNLLANLENGAFPPPSERLFSNPQFLAKDWYDKLLKSKKTVDFEDNKNQFISYLTNLLRYLQVQEKTVEERLAHQQSLQIDFQGINLRSAGDIYYKFSTSLNQIESDIAERKFILNQMQEPGFEISSLSNILKDNVSKIIVDNASQVVLQLNDQRNRSDMERERLRKELTTQSKFLTSHLSQSLQLLELSESLLKEKIYSIQSATLELIHQKISVLEKQVSEFVDSRITGLQQERNLIEQHQKIIRGEMSNLPQKWVAENLIQQHLRINEKMVEEITKLVESKNISNNLEMVQSAPLDFAYPSIHPRSPKILFFASLGGLLGAFFMISTIVALTIKRGIQASKNNLELAEVHVAGELSKDSDDLSVLRRLASYFGTLKGGSILFLQGKAPNYSKNLAALLTKQGDTVLIISLDFNEKTQKDSAGLLQYIEGEISEPEIIPMDGIDTILSGGYSPYGYELVRTQTFSALLTKLKGKYNWVIATNSISPNTTEAEGLIPLFDGAIINVHDETLQSLEGIIDLAKNQKISFVIMP